jgi:hypothetical protein
LRNSQNTEQIALQHFIVECNFLEDNFIDDIFAGKELARLHLENVLVKNRFAIPGTRAKDAARLIVAAGIYFLGGD